MTWINSTHHSLLHRRRVLQWLLLASGSLAGACVTHHPVQSFQDNGPALTDHRIIVVGAGIAGLAAAHALSRQGAQVIVLEAKPHIGGRLLTDHSLGAPFEIGAGWIHGPEGNPVSALAAQINAETVVTDDNSLQVYERDGTVVSNAALRDLDRRFQRLLTAVDEAVDTNDGRSLREAILQVDRDALNDPLLYWALSAFTEFDTGGPIESLSAAYFDEDDAFAGADVVLTQGYDRILAPLAAGLDIRLNTQVTAIASAADGVTVSTQIAALDADAVICAVPLGVLKAGHIAFYPPLPEGHQRAIRQVPMGNVTKVALQFATPFWPLDVQYFGLQSEIKGKWPYVMNYRTFSDRNILVALSFGTYAGQVETRSDAAIQAEIMDSLRVVFGEAIPEPAQMIVTRWSQDPETLGAYSFTGKDVQPRDFAQLAAPVGDRLFFAGEHTTFEYHGTTHGAYLSGIAAATAIGEQYG
ncbi:MAG: FAD-dependent oxidoreductase [Leptolyngbya sp. RL_3_1]|nr:FAD-dependent oxidoreductase [Leptolyngbya sp. RL_3_1]